MQERKPSPEAIVGRLRQGLGDAFEYAFIDHDRVVCRVRKDGWIEAVRLLREDPFLGCTFFSWLSAIDWTEKELADAEAAAAEEEEASTEESEEVAAEEKPASEPEEGGKAADVSPAQPEPDERGVSRYVQPPGELFEVVCHMSAPGRGFGVTLKTALDKQAPSLPSLTQIVAGANWHERECHEMFGIDFEGHPNLSPLYLPEEFEGHPLQKSYVLGARVVKPWPGIVDVEEIPPEIEQDLEARARGEEPS